MNKIRTKYTRVGRYTVEDSSQPYTEDNTDKDIGLHVLAGYERRAVLTVLRDTWEIGTDEIKYARKSIGLTKDELAKNLDIPVTIVENLESGAEPITRIIQLAVAALVEWKENYTNTKKIKIIDVEST